LNGSRHVSGRDFEQLERDRRLSVAVASLIGMTRSGPQAVERAADRAARVAAGLDELEAWLGDQLRAGLAGLDRSGYGQFDPIAARMVDAQAPAVAARLRRLEGVLLSGEGWPGRLLEQFAQLRLLIAAHRRLAELPAPLAAVVRAHIGYPTGRAEVLATPPVRDTWSVLSLRDQEEDRLISRKVWLQGAASGRIALLLSYVPIGRSFDDPPVPGTSLDAELHFYPAGERALIGARHGEPGPLSRPVAVGIAEALAGYAAALAADPWLLARPVLLDGVSPVRAGERWVLRDGTGAALPIAGSVGDPWRLVACSGGEPVTVMAEWGPEGLLPLSVVRRRELVRL
jgi:hypothetical protein